MHRKKKKNDSVTVSMFTVLFFNKLKTLYLILNLIILFNKNHTKQVFVQ